MEWKKADQDREVKDEDMFWSQIWAKWKSNAEIEVCGASVITGHNTHHTECGANDAWLTTLLTVEYQSWALT